MTADPQPEETPPAEPGSGASTVGATRSHRALPLPIAVLLPAAAALLVGLSTLGGGFVFDSVTIIEKDPRHESLGNIPGFFVDNYWGDFVDGGLYRPIPLATFTIERAIFGKAAWGPHLGNTVLSAVVAGFVGLFLLRLGASSLAALAGGLLFAVHPIHTEPVANLVGRAELLALGGALILWCAARSTHPRAPLIGTIGFAVGIFSKESAVAALGVLALLPYFEPERHGTPAERWRAANLERAGLWVGVGAALLVWFLLRSVALGDATPDPPLALDNPLAHRDFVGRVAGALAVVPLWLVKTVFPWPLSADYSLRSLEPTSSIVAPTALSGLVILIGLVQIAVRAARRPEGALWWGLAAVTFLAPLLVVANLVFPTGTIFAERLLFAPSLGLSVLVVGVIERWGKGPARGPILGVLLVAVVAGAVGFVVRAGDWRSERSIAEAIVRVQPASAKGHEKLGYEIYREAMGLEDVAARAPLLEESERSIEHALELCPDYPNAWWNLAVVRRAMNDRDGWFVALERGYAVEPSYDATLRLCRALLWRVRNGRSTNPSMTLTRALRIADDALKKYPRALDFLRLRAECLLLGGRAGDAVPIFEELGRSRPDDVTLAPFLAQIAAMGADFERAKRELDRAIAVDSDDPAFAELIGDRPAHLNNRALVHERLGRAEAAAADRAAIVPLLAAKVELLLELGKVEDARRFLEGNRSLLRPADLETLRARIPAPAPDAEPETPTGERDPRTLPPKSPPEPSPGA